MQYNLTQRERQLTIRLLQLSRHSKDSFEARVVHPDAVGPSTDLVRLDFGDEGQSMELTKRDLRVLKDEGIIYFAWHLPAHGTGRLSTLAFNAVNSNLHTADAPDEAPLAAAALLLADIADEEAIALRFEKITTELVNLTRQLIDEDEASSALREAHSIAEELGKESPKETIIIRKIKGFVSRLSLTFSGSADLASKGALIGEFAERLAAWLVALSVWTDWQAAHQRPANPSPGK